MNESERAIEYFNGYGSPFDKLVKQALQEKAERDNPVALTLEELKQMVGEPVWIRYYNKNFNHGILEAWDIFQDGEYTFLFLEEEHLKFSDYGIFWQAYRHKPKILGKEVAE